MMSPFKERYDADVKAFDALTADLLPLFRIRDDADPASLQRVEDKALGALEHLNLLLAWTVIYNANGWRALGDSARELKSDLIGLVQRIDAAQARAHAVHVEPVRAQAAQAPQSATAAHAQQDMAAARAIMAESAKASAAAARERMRIAQDTAKEIFEMNVVRMEKQREEADLQHKQFIQSIRGSRY
jgi:hypothetical protein